jgi:hypothetical protein
MRSLWSLALLFVVPSSALAQDAEGGRAASRGARNAGGAHARAPGCVVGKVSWIGKLPQLSRLRVDRDTPTCEIQKADESLIVGENGGVANTFIYMTGRNEEGQEGPPPVELHHGFLEQTDCMYAPHGQLVTQGSKLYLRNNDPLPASFRIDVGAQPLLDLTVEPMTPKPPLPVVLPAPGMLRVRSLRDDWQHAVVFVTATPLAALTAEPGTYRIDRVPAGTYKVFALHEPWGTSDAERREVKQVDVPSGATHCVTVDFELHNSESAAEARAAPGE